MFSRTLFL